ncbi:MAG: FAD-dependent monooxygenase [Legionella sp.]|nr:FAD-dependent monooxygenase [Legionella sp.]
MDINNQAADVLIVGAGPTGLILALWLTKLGVCVRIIDKNEHAGFSSRALIVQSRTLELYHQIGIADEVIAQGIPLDYFELRKNAKHIETINLAKIGFGMTPYSFILSFPQDEHERLLEDNLKKMGVSVERNTELISITQNDKTVKALIVSQGRQETTEFAYLCGCDGARSVVREQLGFTFSGSTYQHRFFVADVESSEEVMKGLQIGITDTEFCLAFPIRSSKTVRLIGIVPTEYENKKDIAFANVKASVNRNMHIRIQGVNWFSTYHVHHRLVPELSKGHVFLVGDAAHIHSPVGGQGMNTGIGDAINLSWKLAGVLQGKYFENILETYNLERLPFAKKLVNTTDKLFQLITSNSLLGFAWRSFIFPHVFPFIFRYQSSKEYFFRFVSQLKINYRKSWISGKSRGKLQGGDRLPWVQDNFDSLTHLAWQVHVYGKASNHLASFLENLNMPLFEFVWSKQAQDKGLIKHAAYLIRPDGYISVIDLSPNGNEISNMLSSIGMLPR